MYITGTEVDAMFYDSWPNEVPTLEIDVIEYGADILTSEDVKKMFGIDPFCPEGK